MNTTIRTAAETFVRLRDLSRSHFAGYEAACKAVPVPAGRTADDLAAYSAARIAAAKAAGYTAEGGAELHRLMVAARNDLLRAATPMLKSASLRALRDADAMTRAEAIARAAGVAVA